MVQQIWDKRHAILQIAARYGATNVRIFGSTARGEATPNSDVDILVDLNRAWSLWDRIGLKQDLEDLLGQPVDIAVAADLREVIRESVLEDAITLS